eukprot:3934023-Rhodomonas_salina.1
MDDHGNVHYEGEFSCGKLHGRGKQTLPHGFVEGTWLADSLTCTDGLMEYRDPSTHFVVRYSGGFMDSAKHGFGTQTTHRLIHSGDEQGVWVSTYRGYFQANHKTGVGVWASKKHAYLGLWWDDKLCVTLQQLDADVARTIPVAHFVQQLATTARAPVFPDPPHVQGLKEHDDAHDAHDARDERDTRDTRDARDARDAHTQTDDDAGREQLKARAFAPGDTAVRLKVQVYSLCALTGLPRKECVVPSSHPISSLRLAMPH